MELAGWRSARLAIGILLDRLLTDLQQIEKLRSILFVHALHALLRAFIGIEDHITEGVLQRRAALSADRGRSLTGRGGLIHLIAGAQYHLCRVVLALKFFLSMEIHDGCL